MTYDELLQELIDRRALIVHCSQPARNAGRQRYGDLSGDDLLFPIDLLNAIEAVAGAGELCCSVVWPGHLKTYGSVGIVLRPRTTASIRAISTTDAGSSWDETTGTRTTGGGPFSAEAVADTFDNPTSYNEWNITNADCLGIFVNHTGTLQVAKRVEPDTIDGYDPSASVVVATVAAVTIDLEEVERAFPGRPIFTLHDGQILQLERGPVSPYSQAAASPSTDGATDRAAPDPGE
jgi:hypothetical protein